MKSTEDLKKFYKVYRDGTHINIVFFRHLEDAEDQMHMAKLVETDVQAILKNHPESNFTMLVNLAALEKWPSAIPQKAQRLYLNISRQKQILKAAIVGYETSPNFQTKFVLWLIQMNNKIQWFSNIETAEEWLQDT